MTTLSPLPAPGGRVLVTGGARGIGRAVADAFAAQGARVCILDRDAVPEAPAGWLCIAGNVANPAAVEAAFAAMDAAWGGVDVAIANAGLAMNTPTLDLSAQDWQRALDVNLTGAFLTAQAAARRMVRDGAGLILFTSSLYGSIGGAERAAYCATKAAVANLARALACEWGPAGVRVNALAPGYTETDLVAGLVAAGRLDPKRLAARAPLGRLVQPEEVAALACFLASPAAAAITGAVLPVDAGWAANGAP
ncbi:SDR family NAD(P)-dependent oxidoreductase [Roseomonas sp. HF4]|uniref:SDR family NAD(P)-dependent oxidoreductase n=1 Tax=Roseomonas sp. HF4 TaxID=2562313 RepID=UPI0010C0A4F0|nr:SDR family NAD(P)-dependent oxidoreductase [Roseomonas sp. HF4]